MNFKKTFNAKISVANASRITNMPATGPELAQPKKKIIPTKKPTTLDDHIQFLALSPATPSKQRKRWRTSLPMIKVIE